MRRLIVLLALILCSALPLKAATGCHNLTLLNGWTCIDTNAVSGSGNNPQNLSLLHGEAVLKGDLIVAWANLTTATWTTQTLGVADNAGNTLTFWSLGMRSYSNPINQWVGGMFYTVATANKPSGYVATCTAVQNSGTVPHCDDFSVVIIRPPTPLASVSEDITPIFVPPVGNTQSTGTGGSHPNITVPTTGQTITTSNADIIIAGGNTDQATAFVDSPFIGMDGDGTLNVPFYYLAALTQSVAGAANFRWYVSGGSTSVGSGMLALKPVFAGTYVGPTTVGGGTATSCATAKAASTVVAGDFTPGNIVHLCGTFSGGAGQGPFLTVLGDGAVGNPTTIVFEPGASMSAAVFGPNGAINTNGHSFIVIDGGGTGAANALPSTFVPNGVIQNTANGDQLANQGTLVSGHFVTNLIQATNCNGCVIKNLDLPNSYVASPQNSVVNTQNGATGGCAANCVTRVSGVPFNVNWRTGISNAIKINNVNFTLASVQSTNVATLTSAPGTQTNQPWSWTFGGDITQNNAIVYSGQNTIVTNNRIHDCGWCLLTSYGNNDTAYQVFGNEIYNWDHAQMFATVGPNVCTNDATYGCFNAHDNQIHDNINWETFSNQPALTNCTYHLDGFHFFGNGPGSPNSMDGIYVYNNHFYGNLSGACSSGFIFMESNTTTQGANAKNCGEWNNVFDARNADVIFSSGNSNGWVGMFSCDTTNFMVNNSLLYNDILEGVNNTNGYNISHTAALTFKNNFSHGVNVGNNIGNIGAFKDVNNNVYSGPPCHLSNNCYIFNGSFMSTFANWKSTSGFDSVTATPTYAGALINSDGSPASGSPLISQGANLTSSATGKFATLAFDTTLGGGRTPTARPGAGTWDAGAFNFSSAGGPIIGFSPNPATFGSILVGSTSSPVTITISNTGTSTETYTSITLGSPNAGDFARTGGTCTVPTGTISAAASCTWIGTFTPTATGARSASLTMTGTVTSSGTLSGSGIFPALSFAPNPADFGAIVNGSNASITITITNIGTASETLSGSYRTITGPDAGRFSVTSETCSNGLVIPALSSCTVTVQFSPNAVAPFSATLNIFGTANGSVSLLGTGITNIQIGAPGSLRIVISLREDYEF